MHGTCGKCVTKEAGTAMRICGACLNESRLENRREERLQAESALDGEMMGRMHGKGWRMQPPQESIRMWQDSVSGVGARGRFSLGSNERLPDLRFLGKNGGSND